MGHRLGDMPPEPGHKVLSYLMERQERGFALVSGRESSVALLRASAKRGMSRQRMEQIWGRDFVRVVLEELGK